MGRIPGRIPTVTTNVAVAKFTTLRSRGGAGTISVRPLKTGAQPQPEHSLIDAFPSCAERARDLAEAAR
jgi:hypothetical protein